MPATNSLACFLSPAMDLLRGSYGGASDGKEAEVRRRSPSPKRLRRELPAEPLITFPLASCYSSAGPPLRSSTAFETCRRQICVQQRTSLLAAAAPPSHTLPPLPVGSPGILLYMRFPPSTWLSCNALSSPVQRNFLFRIAFYCLK